MVVEVDARYLMGRGGERVQQVVELVRTEAVSATELGEAGVAAEAWAIGEDTLGNRHTDVVVANLIAPAVGRVIDYRSLYWLHPGERGGIWHRVEKLEDDVLGCGGSARSSKLGKDVRCSKAAHSSAFLIQSEMLPYEFINISIM